MVPLACLRRIPFMRTYPVGHIIHVSARCNHPAIVRFLGNLVSLSYFRGINCTLSNASYKPGAP